MRFFSSIKVRQAILALVILSCGAGIIFLAETVQVPGISKDTFRSILIMSGVLSAFCLVRFLQTLVVILIKQRQFKLAKFIADLHAAIATTLNPCSAEAANAYILQAEIARENLQFSKALQLGEEALHAAIIWSQFINTPVANNFSTMTKKLIQNSVSQQKAIFADTVSLCHESLAGILFDMGQYDEAFNHARNAVAIADENITHGESVNPAQQTRWVLILVCALRVKGQVEITQGALADARADLERAVNLIGQLNGQYSEYTTSAHAYLASTYSLLGENEKAEKAISAGLSMVEGSKLQQFELIKSTLLHHQGQCLLRSGKIDEGIACLTNCLHIREKLLPKGHPEISAVQLDISETMTL